MFATSLNFPQFSEHHCKDGSLDVLHKAPCEVHLKSHLYSDALKTAENSAMLRTFLQHLRDLKMKYNFPTFFVEVLELFCNIALLLRKSSKSGYNFNY